MLAVVRDGIAGLAGCFVLLRLHGLQPKIVTHTAVLGACEKSLQAERALHVFAQWQLLGLLPVVVTFTAVVCACIPSVHVRWPSSLVRQSAKELGLQ